MTLLKRIETGFEAVAANDQDVLVLAHDHDLVAEPIDFSGVTTIALNFPIYRDGRAFTQARYLRRQGFKGVLRATGDVLRDQVLYMVRCGFSEFEVPAGQSEDGFVAALNEYSHYYQRAADAQRPVWALRSAYLKKENAA